MVGEESYIRMTRKNLLGPFYSLFSVITLFLDVINLLYIIFLISLNKIYLILYGLELLVILQRKNRI